MSLVRSYLFTKLFQIQSQSIVAFMNDRSLVLRQFDKLLATVDEVFARSIIIPDPRELDRIDR